MAAAPRRHRRELTGAADRSLLDREIDLFVGECASAETDARFEVAPLTPEQGHWVCRAGHPLLERQTLTVADLTEYVLATPAGPIPETVDLRAFSLAGWILCENLSLLTRIVLESDAISMQSRRSAPLELGSGALRELPLPPLQLQGKLGVVWGKDRPLAPAATKLIEELRGSTPRSSTTEPLPPRLAKHDAVGRGGARTSRGAPSRRGARRAPR